MTARTRPAAPWHLKDHARMLEQQAKECHDMAALYAAMPDPVNDYILNIAAELHKHGLCVIHADVLNDARVALYAFDSDAEDHPKESAERTQAAIKSIEIALHPAPPETPNPALKELDIENLLCDEEIDAIGDSMPGGAAGFKKEWGWRQFARRVLAAAFERGQS